MFTALDSATPAPASTSEPATIASAALEPEGDFSKDACIGRFEILSRAGGIYSATSSVQLNNESVPLLANVVDNVSRCPDLKFQVIAHTDSYGTARANQSLSERRAVSVVAFLAAKGITVSQVQSLGYGETKPIAPNTTAEGGQSNRRIEALVAAE